MKYAPGDVVRLDGRGICSHSGKYVTLVHIMYTNSGGSSVWKVIPPHDDPNSHFTSLCESYFVERVGGEMVNLFKELLAQ